MSEAMRNLVMLVWTVCAINTEALARSQPGISEETSAQRAAASPTMVFGAAQTPGGGEDAVVVEQPEGAPNPLGNPIPEQIENTGAGEGRGSLSQNNARTGENAAAADKQGLNGGISSGGSENSLSAGEVSGNPVVAPSAAEKLGAKFQNTLLESDGTVYDIQAYPEADLPVIGDPANPETIYSPNVNP